MNIINSIETQSLTDIKKITDLRSIPLDDSWLDYKALNKALECGKINVAKHFLSQNFRVNNGNSLDITHKVTPLHYAVKLADVELVQQLLEKEASLSVHDLDGNTPLHLAFMLKHDAIVDLMLSHMEKKKNFIDCKNNQNLTHLHVASTRKNVNVIKGLLKNGANITDTVNKESFLWAGYTALHFAVTFKSLEAVIILVNFSKTIEHSEDSNICTPLQIFEESLNQMLIMGYHLEKNVSDIDHQKLSYFDVACLRGDEKLVNKFIENGAAINDAVSAIAPAYPSSTPLHFAIESKSEEIVNQLLHHGANVNCLNSDKMTPLHLALYTEDFEKNDTIVDRLYTALQTNKEENLTDCNNLSFFHIAVTRNDIEMVKNYLEKGADVNSQVLLNPREFSNFTPLHFAVHYHHLDMAKLLIEHGADVDINDRGLYGTPLQVACDNGNADLIELLLKNDASVNVSLADKLSTPLHLLAEYILNQEDTSSLDHLLIYIDQLAKLGCDINAQDRDGDTALHCIPWETKNCAPFVRLFLELGADVNLQNEDGCLPFNQEDYDATRWNSEEYSLFYDHIQNLKTFGKEVHPKNEECCKMMLEKGKIVKTEDVNQFSDEDLARKEKQRLDEVKKMKNTMITEFMRLYDFMLLEPKRASIYANNEVLKSILDDKDLKGQYPIFHYLIRLQQQKRVNNFTGGYPVKRPSRCADRWM